jgi:pimeloyl-ACP methyl ester carboxylesterase
MYLKSTAPAPTATPAARRFDAAKPTVVFIHGVLNDHSVWILQSRYLANHGWNVLAVDLPGHCRSAGEAPKPRWKKARPSLPRCWMPQGVQARRAGGPQLGFADRAGSRGHAGTERVSHLVLVGTAYPMKVSPPCWRTR